MDCSVEPPTVIEIRDAINRISNSETPGVDNLPTESFKANEQVRLIHSNWCQTSGYVKKNTYILCVAFYLLLHTVFFFKTH